MMSSNTPGLCLSERAKRCSIGPHPDKPGAGCRDPSRAIPSAGHKLPRVLGDQFAVSSRLVLGPWLPPGRSEWLPRPWQDTLRGGTVLTVCRKYNHRRADPLEKGEYEKLVAAFGKFGGSQAARREAAPIIAKYQAMGSGRWFACDCRPDLERPPVLLLREQTHVQRHTTGGWPEHAETCTFFRNPSEQHEVVGSFRRRLRRNGYRLLPAFRPDDGNAPPRPQAPKKASTSRRRSRLAALLMDVVDAAGLQTVAANGIRPTISDQFRHIRDAARRFGLDTGVRVDEFLCTHPDGLERLKTAIANSTQRWTRNRPHGVFIVRVKTVGLGHLMSVEGTRFDIRSKIAVFGEYDGDRRPLIPGADDARSPYLAIISVGQAVADGPIELVDAYVHPCVDDRDLMLIDSDLERQTLDEFRDLRSWLGRRKNIEITVEKPLFDIGAQPEGDENENGEYVVGDDTETRPRDVCIPDFIVRAAPVLPGGAGVIVVETMGFSGREYRDRKERIHPMMSTALDNAPVILHDFCEPTNYTQERRNNRFWTRARWTITGADNG